MSVIRLCLYLFLLIAALTIGAYLFAVASSAQTTTELKLRPDTRRIAFAARQSVLDSHGRKGSYVPTRATGRMEIRSPQASASHSVPAASITRRTADSTARGEAIVSTPIVPGTALHRILHVSELSLTSSAGSDEELFDSNGNLIEDQRKTFDTDGGSTDLAVGQSGIRYVVFPGTLQGVNN